MTWWEGKFDVMPKYHRMMLEVSQLAKKYRMTANMERESKLQRVRAYPHSKYCMLCFLDNLIYLIK